MSKPDLDAIQARATESLPLCDDACPSPICVADSDRVALLAYARDLEAQLAVARDDAWQRGYDACKAGEQRHSPYRAALTVTEEPADSHHVRCNAAPDHEGTCSWPVFAALTATEGKA